MIFELKKHAPSFSSILITVSLLLGLSVGYPTCQRIDVQGYTYDLTSLSGQTLFEVTGDETGFANIAYCEPTLSCAADNTAVSFAYFTPINGECQLHANSQKPLQANYSLININTPKKGIKISYLPLKDSQTGEIRKTELNIHCSSTGSTISDKCAYTKNSTSNPVSSTLSCSIYPSNPAIGCGTLQQNYFWRFLQDHAIVFAILIWFVAIFELLFGYMTIRLTIFTFGILTGSFFGVIYTAHNYVDFYFEDEGESIAVFVICLSVFMGVLLGIMLLTLPRLGYVNIGLWVAIIVALLLQNGLFYLTGSLTAFYITFGVVGLLMTILALMGLRYFIVISTSFISGFWIIRPLGFFLPSYPNEFVYGENYEQDQETEWQFYLYLISIMILSVLGAAFQFCCTAKSRHGNESYYLEEEGTFKEKLQKLLEFREVRQIVKNGTDELRFFKDLVVDHDSDDEDQSSKYESKANRYQAPNVHELEGSSDSTPQPRKPTRLEMELEDYNKKPKKDKVAQKPIRQEKVGQVNRKKVHVEEVRISSDDSSSEESSNYIKPNKLTVPPKKKK